MKICFLKFLESSIEEIRFAYVQLCAGKNLWPSLACNYLRATRHMLYSEIFLYTPSIIAQSEYNRISYIKVYRVCVGECAAITAEYTHIFVPTTIYCRRRSIYLV